MEHRKNYFIVIANGEEKIRTNDRMEAIRVFSEEANEWEQHKYWAMMNNEPYSEDVPYLYEEFV